MSSTPLLRLTLGVCFLLAAAAIPAQDALPLYVAPNGADTWSGRLESPAADGSDGPLATLTGARDAIRALKAGGFSGPVTVRLRGGVYRLTEAVRFSPQDSGAPGAGITYAAYPGEKPLISGGALVTGWRVEDGVWAAPVPAASKSLDGEPVALSALWVNGEYRRPARFPNEGFLKTAGKAPAGKDPETGAEVDRSKNAFVYAEGDFQSWPDLDQAVVVIYHSWDTSYHHVKSLEEDARIVNLTGTTMWDMEHWGPGQRYFIERVRAALDAPGEWYQDESAGLIYYIPMSGETPENTEVIAPAADQLIVLEGDASEGALVTDLRFEGLRLAHTQYTLPPEGLRDYQAAFPIPGAFHARGARRCAIEGCEIFNISNYAIWFGLGCQDNRVVRNHCHALGAGGVRIGEGASPEKPEEAALRNFVDNNWLHDGGLIFPAAVGVWIGRSSYNTVSHNEISDFYYTGVSVGWSWGYAESSANHNIIEYNHIHDLGKGILSDMGGIYTLGIAPGTILRYNHIHGVESFYYGGWGIYPDEGSSDLLIENNVAYDTKTGGFHQHYGKENRVINNVFAYSTNDQVVRSREEEHISFFFERNIVYFDNGKLLGSAWKNGNYWLDSNCYWDTSSPSIDFKGRTFEQWRAEGNDLRSIIADPMFVDPAKRDFRLKPESPALKLGIRSIDISQAGLYGDPAWVNGPGKR